MMKKSLNILVILATMAVALNMASCSDDELGATIFDTNEYPLDRHAYTFPLDTFIKKNFLEQYNMRYIYRMQYISSDKDKNLTPEDLDAFCKESPDIANFKRPRFYRFIEQIPRNATGKKLHVRIKEIAKDDLINGLLYRV